MKTKFLLLVLVLSFTSLTAGANDLEDQEACATNQKHMITQLEDAHVKQMVTDITEVLINAYHQIGLTITEDKIRFYVPQSKIEETNQTSQVPSSFVITTTIEADVDAGEDSIRARGTSTIDVNKSVERQSTVDKIGRIKSTKLFCSLSASYYETAVRNVNGGEIDNSYNSQTFEVTLELP